MHPALIGLAAVATAGFGTLAGLGGAVLLVPILTLGGLPPDQAIPLGLATVAAGSLAAAADQIESGFVNHRIGVTVEVAAGIGAIGGAAIGRLLSAPALEIAVAAAALIAAGANLVRPREAGAQVGDERSMTAGEYPRELGGAYPGESGLAPYRAERTGLGTTLMLFTGVLAGLSGTSGGFVKTPVMHHVMRVPVKVASATTTFGVGITAAAALLVLAPGNTIDPRMIGVAVVGALAGGRAGVALHRRAPAAAIRAVLVVILVAIAVVLIVR